MTNSSSLIRYCEFEHVCPGEYLGHALGNHHIGP